MTTAVTGATGRLGRLVVLGLLDAGVPPGDVVAVVRTPAKAAGLAERGVVVRQGDYTEPEQLRAALTGVETVLLVSSSQVGQRTAQHAAVIGAAVAVGVQRLVYTSLLRADTTQLPLAPEHEATEALLRDSGLRVTVLRNGWYTENYTTQLAGYLQRGEVLGAAGDAMVAAATIADYAAAAVAVLTEEGHDGAVYELGGTPFTLAELATTVTEVTGTPVVYRDLPVAELARVLEGSGMPAGTAGFVASLSEASGRGDMNADPATLTRLIGRPSTPLRDAVAAAHTPSPA